MKANRILSVSVAGLALLVSYNTNAAVVQEGSCGGECTWTLDDKGVFSTVNGSTATGEFSIPEGTKKITSRSFMYASGLTNITIPDSVTSIEWQAFFGMNGVTGKLKIPDSVKSIGGYAFSGMSGVTGALKIPEGLTSIEQYAFSNLSSVTGELKIPSSVTSIGTYAFFNMNSVTSVMIPDSVTSIGTGAFYSMTSLSEVFLSADSPLTNEMLKSASINLSKIVRYTADGKYIKDGKTYASLEDYRNGTTFVYNEAKGKYQKMDRDGVLLDGYYNPDGSKLKYRIYTVSEATAALGTENKNTFKLRYR